MGELAGQERSSKCFGKDIGDDGIGPRKKWAQGGRKEHRKCDKDG